MKINETIESIKKEIAIRTTDIDTIIRSAYDAGYATAMETITQREREAFRNGFNQATFSGGEGSKA
jgi:hypothetical protein